MKRLITFGLAAISSIALGRADITDSEYACAKADADMRTYYIALVPHTWTNTYTECSIYNPKETVQNIKVHSIDLASGSSDPPTMRNTVTSPGADPFLNIDVANLKHRESLSIVWNRAEQVPRALEIRICEDESFLVGNCTIWWYSTSTGSSGQNTIFINTGEPF